jgi:hypothetical protein
MSYPSIHDAFALGGQNSPGKQHTKNSLHNTSQQELAAPPPPKQPEEGAEEVP